MDSTGKQELPFVNELAPVVDGCINLPNDGRSLEDWVIGETADFSRVLENRRASGIESPSVFSLISEMSVRINSSDLASLFAGMIKIGHPILKGFTERDKRELLKEGLRKRLIEEYGELAYLEAEKEFRGSAYYSFARSIEMPLMERIYRTKNVIHSLGARVTPSPDISRK